MQPSGTTPPHPPLASPVTRRMTAGPRHATTLRAVRETCPLNQLAVCDVSRVASQLGPGGGPAVNPAQIPGRPLTLRQRCLSRKRGAVGAVENRTAVFQAACGRVLCVHSGGSVHGFRPGAALVRPSAAANPDSPVHQLLNLRDGRRGQRHAEGLDSDSEYDARHPQPCTPRQERPRVAERDAVHQFRGGAGSLLSRHTHRRLFARAQEHRCKHHKANVLRREVLEPQAERNAESAGTGCGTASCCRRNTRACSGGGRSFARACPRRGEAA